jgi:hypothetical protein
VKDPGRLAEAIAVAEGGRCSTRSRSVATRPAARLRLRLRSGWRTARRGERSRRRRRGRRSCRPGIRHSRGPQVSERVPGRRARRSSRAPTRRPSRLCPSRPSEHRRPRGRVGKRFEPTVKVVELEPEQIFRFACGRLRRGVQPRTASRSFAAPCPPGRRGRHLGQVGDGNRAALSRLGQAAARDPDQPGEGLATPRVEALPVAERPLEGRARQSSASGPSPIPKATYG